MAKWDTVFVECLKEMFRRVGERYPNKKLTDYSNWYCQRAWTETELQNFRKWMRKHVRKRMRCYAVRAAKETGYFILKYAWSTPHDDGTLTVLGKEKKL